MKSLHHHLERRARLKAWSLWTLKPPWFLWEHHTSCQFIKQSPQCMTFVTFQKKARRIRQCYESPTLKDSKMTYSRKQLDKMTFTRMSIPSLDRVLPFQVASFFSTRSIRGCHTSLVREVDLICRPR